MDRVLDVRRHPDGIRERPCAGGHPAAPAERRARPPRPGAAEPGRRRRPVTRRRRRDRHPRHGREGAAAPRADRGAGAGRRHRDAADRRRPRRAAGGPPVARCARRRDGAHAALRPRVHAARRRRASRPRRHPGPPRRAHRGQRALRAVRVPTRAQRDHADEHPRRRPAPPALAHGRVRPRHAPGQRRAGGCEPRRAGTARVDPASEPLRHVGGGHPGAGRPVRSRLRQPSPRALHGDGVGCPQGGRGPGRPGRPRRCDTPCRELPARAALRRGGRRAALTRARSRDRLHLRARLPRDGGGAVLRRGAADRAAPRWAPTLGQASRSHGGGPASRATRAGTRSRRSGTGWTPTGASRTSHLDRVLGACLSAPSTPDPASPARR